MIKTYLQYKEKGLACLPTRDKVPAIPKNSSWNNGWEIEKDYSKAPGIGIVCGKASGGLECIDFDNHFGDAESIFVAFGEMPAVAEVIARYNFAIEKTLRGGFHIVYRCDLIEGNQKLALRQNNAKAEALIETRGEGGYFCAAPTPGYKLLTETFDPPVITGQDRMILLSACRSFNEVVKPVRRPEEDTDRPGDVYNRSPHAIDDMKSALVGAGWKELSEGIWQRPGKERGISATLGKAAPGIFYNFSANGDPFELKGYTAFQVVALLKYNGDFKAFAKDLHDQQKRPEVYQREGVGSECSFISNTPHSTFIELEKRLRVDLTVEPTQAPAILYMKRNSKLIPSFTLQDFSLITGKAKSRKTFLTVLIVASYLGYVNDIIVPDYDRMGTVLIFDTEQSPWHLHRMMKRICSLIGQENPPRLQAYKLKTLTPEEKKNFIDYKIRNTPGVKLVVIDGIRDLVFDINSPEEATRTSVMLMKWAADFDLHIMNVLHQNKGDANARGHLGTELVNKAGTVLSVNKEGDKAVSTVDSDYSRDVDFDKFSFTINEETTLPEICGFTEEVTQAKRSEPNKIPNEKHFGVLNTVFKGHCERQYKDAWMNIKLGFADEEIHFGDNRAKEYLEYYVKEGWVSKDENRKYRYERAIF